MKLLEAKDEIERTEKLLLDKLKQQSKKQDFINVSHRGGSQRREANWSEKLGIWWAAKETRNRFWNAFGTGEPKWSPSSRNNITCEINPPYEGIDRRIAGAFAKDSDGRLYILHRGKFGGGKSGVGKELFLRHFQGSWEEVEDGIKVSDLALVACFDNSRCAEQIANFVHEVERIKSLSIRKT